MKKKIIYIIVFIIIIAIIYYFIFKQNNMFAKNSNNKNIQDVFDDIKVKYGLEIAENVEKIYRLETAHFTSEGYKKTGAAGMMSFGLNYPYGWDIFINYWAVNKKYKPSGVVSLPGSDGIYYNYLKFNNFGGFYTLAEFLKQHDNNPGRWNSIDPMQQNNYNNIINSINTTYV